jgi:hypothetical protein
MDLADLVSCNPSRAADVVVLHNPSCDGTRLFQPRLMTCVDGERTLEEDPCERNFLRGSLCRRNFSLGGRQASTPQRQTWPLGNDRNY